jgi:sigma-B regulation protein RsbU (phosphoserine phosphatase)
VLFTDGVTEAEAQNGALWGIERLTALLNEIPSGEPAALVKQIVDAVAAHASGYHVSDDLTVMAVRFVPPTVTTRMEVATGVHWLIDVEISPAGIKLAQQRLYGILAARDIAPERIGDVELDVEELLTNIVRAAAAKTLTLDCALTPEDIVLAIRDNGVEFDPLKPESPDLDADIAERSIGGLGIHLVRQLADDCSYTRVAAWNVFAVRLARTAK